MVVAALPVLPEDLTYSSPQGRGLCGCGRRFRTRELQRAPVREEACQPQMDQPACFLVGQIFADCCLAQLLVSEAEDPRPVQQRRLKGKVQRRPVRLRERPILSA